MIRFLVFLLFLLLRLVFEAAEDAGEIVGGAVEAVGARFHVGDFENNGIASWYLCNLAMDGLGRCWVVGMTFMVCLPSVALDGDGAWFIHHERISMQFRHMKWSDILHGNLIRIVEIRY